jgi:hypothetical protein
VKYNHVYMILWCEHNACDIALLLVPSALATVSVDVH